LLSSRAAQRVALRRKKCPNHPLYGFFYAGPAVGVMPPRETTHPQRFLQAALRSAGFEPVTPGVDKQISKAPAIQLRMQF